MSPKRPTAALISLVFLVGAAPARADERSPDIVRKRDGGFMRGSIEELDPSGSVTILLPSGERRTLPMHDVEDAGLAANDPKRPPTEPKAADDGATKSTKAPTPTASPRVLVEGPAARIHCEARESGLTLHLKTTEAGFVGGGLAFGSRRPRSRCESSVRGPEARGGRQSAPTALPPSFRWASAWAACSRRNCRRAVASRNGGGAFQMPRPEPTRSREREAGRNVDPGQ